MSASRKRKPTRRELIHEEITTEWLGCSPEIKLNRNISAASDWISKILKQQFFSDQLEEEEVKSAWKEIAGDFIGKHTQPVSAADGLLILKVTQPAMRFHLEQMKPQLLKQVIAHFGEGKIHSIRFTLG